MTFASNLGSRNIDITALHNSCYLRFCGVFKGGKGEFVPIQHQISRQQRLLSTTVLLPSLYVVQSVCREALFECMKEKNQAPVTAWCKASQCCACPLPLLLYAM